MGKKWLSNAPGPTLLCVLLSGAALAASLGGWFRGVLPLDPAWLAVALCGIPIVTGAVSALIREHSAKADALVSLALAASLGVGEIFAAGEVALIMQLGSLLEDFTAGRAKKGVESLIRMIPDTARVRRDGNFVSLPAGEVRPGDTLLVLAGETIPADGALLSETACVDQSAMTGESLPAEKKAGDSLLSGTVNQAKPFEMKASRGCADSSLQRMTVLAREAGEHQAPLVRQADKWAGYLVGAALGAAGLTWLLTGEFLRAVTVLVVFCPCAFVLAAPTAVAAAMGNLAKYGVLIRTGDALERFSRVDCAAFDKTGTLTAGKPRVTGTEVFREDMTEEELLRLAALAEQRSEHPLGKAVTARYLAGGGAPEPVSEVRVLPGRGISARVEGRLVTVGRRSLFPEAAGEETPGLTRIFVSVDGELSGAFTLADTVRPESRDAVERLRAMGVESVLLTGDGRCSAESAAEQTGVKEIRAELLPEEKLEAVRGLEKSGRKVCMIGDGVNDAPALSAAWAGVAMGGGGCGAAMESADAVLVGDDLGRLPYLFSAARGAVKKIRQNLILSMIINCAAVLLSALGLLTPVTGALTHNAGSVLVVVNAALLLRKKAK